MKKFVFFVVLPITLLFVFISGSLPYTLIYSAGSLKNTKLAGKEPITAEVMRCKIEDTEKSRLGVELETSFHAKLRNNTDRFVAISMIGEVQSSAGHSAGARSKFFILFPNTEKEIRFRSSTFYSRTGSYKCNLRYAIGSVQYW